MPPVSSTQQSRSIAEFNKVTKSADKTLAAKYLRSHNWDIGRAVDGYFSDTTLNQIFDDLRDKPEEHPDTMKIEGTMKYFELIGVDLEGVDMLVASELVRSPTFGEIHRDGFLSGWSSLSAETAKRTTTGVDTLAKQHNRMKQLMKSLASDRALYTRVYKHTFVLARAEGKKSVQLESALQYWQLLFASENSPVQWESPTTPWLEWWFDFLETEWKKDINKDLWEQTLKFAERCLEDGSLSWWSEDSAWPGVIDEFVMWVQAKWPSRGEGEEMEIE